MKPEKTTSLPAAYDPQEVEARWYPLWESAGYFKASASSAKPPFSIVIPPPNVTGFLHMGHALNATLQDMLARYKRMRGFNVLWLPGCDHAGIATQNVVEKQLKKEGKSRHDLGREAFVKRTWEWKEKYGGGIMKQLRTMGASLDWSRERFTMDEGLSRAVQHVFLTLYKEGLIYRGNYLINWCPRCQTALSDIEVEHKIVQGNFYHIRYPFADDPTKFVEVATTRPETLLGDSAVAVNPEDERYTSWVGRKVRLPLTDRVIPVIADAYVDREFGTGVVKITPAHDFNDFAVGDRHNLERINILNADGTLNENAGPYRGLDRFVARAKVLEDLEKQGWLLKTEPHEHNVGHCYRCSTIVEPYYSKQWFVKMKPLAEEALKAVADGRTKFVPEMWRGEYERWLNNIHDWCISRQIWWGHRIPVYYCDACGKDQASSGMPSKCLACGHTSLTQDPDVLDTWFSSGLWPFSTLGWPDSTPELKAFYPTSVLVTSWDILTFWVARMMMMGLKFTGDVPFREVYIYSLVADEEGKKMSKSTGNVVDPLELIGKYGTDALRFTLASIETKQRYVALTPTKLESSRNFVNKLYNSVRFLRMATEGMELPSPRSFRDDPDLALEDRWILTRLAQVTDEVTGDYEKYRVAELSTTLYHFLWHEVCDWYLEALKPRLYHESSTPEGARVREKAAALAVTVLESLLRLLHPQMPFVTEELWHTLPHEGDSIQVTAWPEPDLFPSDPKAVEEFRLLQESVTVIRTARSEVNVPPAANIKVSVKGEAAFTERLRKHAVLLNTLARVGELEIVPQRPERTSGGALAGGEIYVHLDGLVDLKQEQARQQKEIEKLDKYLLSLRTRIANPQFAEKAPASLIEAEKQKIVDSQARLERLKNNLQFLKD